MAEETGLVPEKKKLWLWLLLLMSGALLLLAIGTMTTGFRGWSSSVVYGVCGVLLLCLSLLILVGVLLPSPVCIRIAYYATAVTLFFNTLTLVFVLIAMMDTSKELSVDEKSMRRVQFFICLVTEVFVLIIGLLIYVFATKHMEHELRYSPLDLLKCGCFFKSRPQAEAPPAASAPSDA